MIPWTKTEYVTTEAMAKIALIQTEITIVKYAVDEKALYPHGLDSFFLIGQPPNICSNFSNGQKVVSILPEFIFVRAQDTN